MYIIKIYVIYQIENHQEFKETCIFDILIWESAKLKKGINYNLRGITEYKVKE